MFAVHLRRVYYSCDKIIVRFIRRKNYIPYGPNPGLDRRVDAFQKEGLKINDVDAEEMIEHSDTDFYKVGEAYNEHMNETLMGKYELQHRIVKEKYFKENMPNLLTWSEKEQIRHLVEQEPQEWTPERIAESFPVTVPVVKKLLKYVWKPATEERIARHDASVMRNWRELKEGTLSIPKDLREHFLKFSNRTIPPLRNKPIKTDLTTSDKLGEFEEIVRRCAANENSSTSNVNNNNEDVRKSEKLDNSKKNLFKVPEKITLDELTAKIKKRLDSGQKTHISDKIMMEKVTTSIQASDNISKEIELPNEDSQRNSVALVSDEQVKEDNIMNYPERIRIPKKAYKKGATYKVNDCYYDHDGRFLYRVLGMSKYD